ncbi:MAG TPA: alpha/beta hydrolase, partial [Caulifigura sp.]|nr:alpha/beta hydrolase [Caulifigura sp.]
SHEIRMRQSPLLQTFLTAILLTTAWRAPAAETIRKDVEYARIGERSLALDLYRPDSNDPAPVVVWVHGGAWRSGSKNDVPVKRWLEHGLAIASVDYRLSPEAQFPAPVHDIKAAIRYLQANAITLEIDPGRVVVAGSSAGGHLAALVGVSNGVKPLEGDVGVSPATPARVHATVSFFGASNLESILSQSTPHGLSVRVPALKLLLGGTPEEKPDLARLASPVTHVDKSDPPLWLIHGDADPQMPIEQSKELAARYEQLKLPVSFETIPGGKHGGPEFFEPQRLDRLASELKKSLVRHATD